ncbi:MAG: amidohydrolase family protein [Phycisphaeraceae bacterium]|nr:amidohydrolase family protein [Phycisphaeraceae bacterium]
MSFGTAGTARVWTANRLGLDYRIEASRLGLPVTPIIDIHAHLAGAKAPAIHLEAARLFGVRRIYSMTQRPGAAVVRDALGDAVRFIAFPSWADPDKNRAHRAGYVQEIELFRRDLGSRILKIWASPRLREVVPDLAQSTWGATDLAEVDSAWRVKACEVGERLGMMFMIHVADPDTWFASRYSDARRFGTKRQQYEGFERMLDRFSNPWIAAHMGGWPEDLEFLGGMLARHPNLYLDTSATKWIVRELGRHPRAQTAEFFAKWTGRILFGSDIVSTDDHLQPAKATTSPMADLASSAEEAFDLYASRYLALRTMFETTFDGDSPIADPDLMMMDPDRFNAMSAPRLVGLGLAPTLLQTLYSGAAHDVVERWEAEHP